MESKGCQKNQRYKFRRYWESRFVHEDHYEWLVDFAEVEGLLLGCGVLSQKQVDSSFCSPKILVVGCGNSSFSKDLYNTGLRDVCSIDYSVVVIEKMKLKEPLLQWKVMDMTDMKEFQNNSFDIVIDKAAMDALVTDEGDPWHPSETAKSSSSAMVCMAHSTQPLYAF